jgi:hypothetical protein
MSRHGEITRPLGDADYKFRLGYDQLRQIQEACDAGPGWIANQLRLGVNGPWRVEYVREPIRIGLIGGGMEQGAALALVRKFVEPHLADCMLIAWTIINAGLTGATDESLGKAPGATEKKAKRSRKAKSPSQSSSARPQQSVSPSATSTQ